MTLAVLFDVFLQPFHKKGLENRNKLSTIFSPTKTLISRPVGQRTKVFVLEQQGLFTVNSHKTIFGSRKAETFSVAVKTGPRGN